MTQQIEWTIPWDADRYARGVKAVATNCHHQTLTEVIGHLEQLRHNQPYPGSGICLNLYKLMGGWDMASTVISVFAVGWQHHSCFYARPIDGSEYNKAPWEGKGLERRLSLIEYVISAILQYLSRPADPISRDIIERASQLYGMIVIISELQKSDDSDATGLNKGAITYAKRHIRRILGTECTPSILLYTKADCIDAVITAQRKGHTR